MKKYKTLTWPSWVLNFDKSFDDSADVGFSVSTFTKHAKFHVHDCCHIAKWTFIVFGMARLTRCAHFTDVLIGGVVNSHLSHSHREGDWLFSSDAGLRGLVEQSGYQRLVVVAMYYGHRYSDLDHVKAKVSGNVLTILQTGVPDNIKDTIHRVYFRGIFCPRNFCPPNKRSKFDFGAAKCELIEELVIGEPQ